MFSVLSLDDALDEQIALKDYIGKLKESVKPKELAKKEKTSTYS